MTERQAIRALLEGRQVPDGPEVRPALKALEAAGAKIERDGTTARLAAPVAEKAGENPVLLHLLENPGEWFSAKALAGELGISTYRVEKLIKDIREAGIALERKRGRGLRLGGAAEEKAGKREARHAKAGKPKPGKPSPPPRPRQGTAGEGPPPAKVAPTADRRPGRRLARALGMALGFFLFLALAGAAWFGTAWVEAWRDGRLDMKDKTAVEEGQPAAPVSHDAAAKTARAVDKVAADLERLLTAIRDRSREMDRRLTEVERRLAARDGNPPRHDPSKAREGK